MRVKRTVGAAVFAAAILASPCLAQSLSEIMGPKELPPAGFKARQYVDSAGCVFVRAGVGTRVLWVPRVTRDRKLVCGYEPSVPLAASKLASGESAAPVATDSQKLEPVVVSKPAVPSAKPVVSGDKGDDLRLVHDRPVEGSATLCNSATDPARRYLLSDGRRVTRCSGTIENDAVTYLNDLGAPGLVVGVAPARAKDAARARALDAAGRYRVTWSKGKLRQATGDAADQARYYVQVGAFSDRANASRAGARLSALGLPTITVDETSGGKVLGVVLAGPFVDATARAQALATARRSGFADAFPRG